MLGRTDVGAASERARDASAAPPLRLIYADADERYRVLLGAVLKTYPRFAVVGIAADGEQAVALACTERPDIVLLDVELTDGREAARVIAEELPSAQIVLHGPHAADNVVDKLAIHETLQRLL